MFRFRQINTFLTIAILLFFFSGQVISQQIHFSETSNWRLDSGARIQMLGYSGDHPVAMQFIPHQPAQLIVFDQKGRLNTQVSCTFIDPTWISQVQVSLQEGGILYLLQGQKNGKHYVATACTNEKGELTGSFQYIDSTDYFSWGPMAYYRVTWSPDKRSAALSRFASGFSDSQLLFNALLVDGSGQLKGKVYSYLPVNFDMEMIGNVFLNDRQELFFTLLDKPQNFRLGSAVRIYRSGFDSSPPRLMSVYLKENKPAELLMTWSDASNQLVLGGLYYNFYSRHLEGALYIFMNSVTERCDTIVYHTMDRIFKKKLKDRIYGMSVSEAVDNMTSQWLGYTRSGALILATEMFNNSAIAGRTSDPASPVSSRRSIYNNASNANKDIQLTSPLNNNNAAGSRTTGSSSRSLYQDRTGASNSNSTTTPSVRNTGRVVDDPNSYFTRNQQTYLKEEGQPNNSVRGYGEDLISANKHLDYKTVLFGLDDSLKCLSKSWLRSLYIPQTPYSVATLLPADSTIGLISYEINDKNRSFLLHQSVQPEGQPVQRVILDESNRKIFFHTALLVQKRKCLVMLYEDKATGNLGLAEISW